MSRCSTFVEMSSFARILLVVGMLLAASTAAGATAATPPWQVVARSHKWPTSDGQPGFVVRMPVGRRQPDVLAVRLLVRRQGRYVRGWVSYIITCGGWRQVRTNIQGKTPFIREIPFRTWRARTCTITLGGNAFRSGEDVRLQLLCRARSRAACTPVSD